MQRLPRFADIFQQGIRWINWLNKQPEASVCPVMIAYSALFDHGLASKSDQRFASIRLTENLTFSIAFQLVFSVFSIDGGFFLRDSP
ncbi:hypothetical protein JHI62_004528 [Escherichia coli]|nr:hypothetical protein [Escherichia coli]EEV5796430.1 hypothetical protein [Escherichia coli]EEV5876707.1 hypothetical protein [Escherichia coli]EEV6167460.1 hypothetical protein [Escherichia coli]EEV6211556.1 hypothetical protein [Escherichia coli]